MAEGVNGGDRRSVERVERASRASLDCGRRWSRSRPARICASFGASPPPDSRLSSLARTRVRISWVAFSVKVTQRSWSSVTSVERTSSTTRLSSVKVFPVPADASMIEWRSSGMRLRTSGRATRRVFTASSLASRRRRRSGRRSWRAHAPHPERRYSCGRDTGPYADRSASAPSASPRMIARLLEPARHGALRVSRGAHEDRLAGEEIRRAAPASSSRTTARSHTLASSRVRASKDTRSLATSFGCANDDHGGVRSIRRDARRRQHGVVHEGAQRGALALRRDPGVVPLFLRALGQGDRGASRRRPSAGSVPPISTRKMRWTPPASTTSTSSVTASNTLPAGACSLARPKR